MRWAKYLLITSLLFAQEGLRVYPENGVLQFNGGLNTKVSENLVPANQSIIAENVLFDETLGFKSRSGITAISSYPVSGVTCQKIWSLEKSNGEKYFVGSFESSLYYTVTLMEWTLIRSGLSWQLNPIHAAVYQDKLWFTNGINDLFYFDGNTYSGNLYGEVALDSIRGKYICTHNNKLFLGNFYDGATKIRYNDENSDAALIVSWPEANFELAGYQSGDIITSLKSSRNALIIGLKRSLWGLFGYSWDNWEIHKINSDYGVWDNDSVQDDKGTVKFLSNKGVVEFNGSSVNKIDWAVEDEFLGANNLYGEFYYWQNTDSVDWAAGTSTGVTEGAEEMYLEDLTKVWDSSSTFSSGTLTGIDTFGEDLVLTSTGASFQPFDITSFTNNEVKMVGSSGSWGWLYGARVGPFGANGESYYLRNEAGKNWWSLLGNAIDGDDTTGGYKMSGGDYVYPQTAGGNLKHTQAVTNYWFAVDSYYNFTILPDMPEKLTSLRVKADISFPTSIYFDIWRADSGLTNKYKGKEIGVKTYLDATVHFVKGGTSNYSKLIGRSYVTVDGVYSHLGTTYKQWFSVPSTIVKNYDGNDIYLSINNENEEITSIDISIRTITYAEERPRYGTYNFYTLNCVKILKLYEIETKTYIYKKLYESTGTYTTEIHDFGYQSYLSTFTANVTNDYEKHGTTVTFKIKTSSYSATLAGETWTDLNGDVANGFQLPPALSPCRYVQVLSSFSTTMSSYTPTLQSISVGATRSTGTWTSKKFNAGKVTGGWKYIVDSSIKYGQTIDYSVKTATGSTALDSASWDSVSSGDLLDSGIHPSTHTWYQIKAEFSTNDGRQNPTLESLTQTYCPVSEPIITASASIEDRYYLAISTGDYTDNRLVRVYDKQGAWTDFIGWNPVDFAEYNNNWYMAERDGIYLIDLSATTDNGAAITSKWQKYFDFGLQANDKYLAPAYITGRKGTGTYDFEYSLENSTVTYSVTIDQSGSGIYNRRVGIRSLSGVRGFYETIKSTSPIEIHNLQNFYTVEQLR